MKGHTDLGTLLSFENPIYGNVGGGYDDVNLERTESDDDLREYKDGPCARCWLLRPSSRCIIITATAFVAAVVIIVIGLGAYFGTKEHRPAVSPSKSTAVSLQEAKVSKEFELEITIVGGDYSDYLDVYKDKASGQYGELKNKIISVINEVYSASAMASIFQSSSLNYVKKGSVIATVSLEFSDYVLVLPTKQPTLDYSGDDIRNIFDTALTNGNEDNKSKLGKFIIDRNQVKVTAVRPIPYDSIRTSTTTTAPTPSTPLPVPATHPPTLSTTTYTTTPSTTTTTTSTNTTPAPRTVLPTTRVTYPKSSTVIHTSPSQRSTMVRSTRIPKSSTIHFGTPSTTTTIPSTTRTTTTTSSSTTTTTTTTQPTTTTRRTTITPSLNTPGPVQPMTPLPATTEEPTTSPDLTTIKLMTSGKVALTTEELPASSAKHDTSSSEFGPLVTPEGSSTATSSTPVENSTLENESTSSSLLPSSTVRTSLQTSRPVYSSLPPFTNPPLPTLPPANETESCPPGYYRCVDGVITLTAHRTNCINAVEKCDGVTDCRGGEDERDCGTNCTGGGFRCRTPGATDRLLGGFCTLRDRVCDGRAECSDRSDEWDCDCGDGQFKCTYGYDVEMGDRCVEKGNLCDRVQDCSDGSDERNCTYQCPDGHFMCSTGTVNRLQITLEPSQRFCIRDHEQCDGFQDCEDNSDEVACNTSCPVGKFRCDAPDAVRNLGSGRTTPCYLPSDKCDRMADCSDGSDEFNCNYTCPENKFKCVNGTLDRYPYVGFCLHDYERCDGHKQCADGSDEDNCPGITCSDIEFKCDNGTADVHDDFCIPAKYVCDKVNDCYNATGPGEISLDEEGCDYKCGEKGTFSCAQGVLTPMESKDARGFCLPGIARCDGRKHCLDGSDEANCDVLCEEDKFLCETGISIHTDTGDRCVPSRYVCDREADCTDGSDEPSNCTYSCSDGNVACLTGTLRRWPFTGYCYFRREKCDGFQDCDDNSDEENCEDSTCSPDEFACESKQDIFFGNGCLSSHYRCDRHPQCVDGSDERSCNITCAHHQFLCTSGRTSAISPHEGYCVNTTYVCDGKEDCADGSDEEQCEPEVVCADDEFACTSGHDIETGARCINKVYRCDRVKDCSDYSDELNCGPKDSQCAEDQFMCVNGTVNFNSSAMVDSDAVDRPRGYCIPDSKKCDLIQDCMDGSDESEFDAGCEICNDNQFRCVTGHASRGTSKCILARYTCDRDDDCMDGSDEQNCEYPCPDGEIACLTGTLKRWPFYGYCIRLTDVCDDFQDCRDNSDETNCTGASGCNHAQFTCKNGTDKDDGDNCIHMSYKCDRYEDCTDGSDEADCDYQCPEGQFKCLNGTTKLEVEPARGFCLQERLVCDNVGNCEDGSDEFNCEVTCSAGYIPCEKGVSKVHGSSCILQQWQCDREEDCQDGSDEKTCDYTCPDGEKACASGVLSRWPFFGYCIPDSDWCDGFADCEDGSDELACQVEQPECPPRHFQCVDNSTVLGEWCVPMSVRCDRVDDCRDGSDEKDCDYTCTDKFMCESGAINSWPHRGYCIPNNTVCDGVYNCNDTSDEVNCNGKCSIEGYVRCKNGTLMNLNSECYPESDVCNGIQNCLDNSDEFNCTLPAVDDCGEHKVACSAGFVWYMQQHQVRCINETERCDGFVDCEDHSDELGCDYNCTDSEFRCGQPGGVYGSVCISGEKLCDGQANCINQMDEAVCPTTNSTITENEFLCRSRGEEEAHSLPLYKRCDGVRECPDGSDEEHCNDRHRPLVNRGTSPP